ncbi:MAG: aminomethyl-transferring glycine dehydrogenase subunit GcvPB, partial [Humidesulfovibrio sp.]|nr:aminomethyl-transferring glycine dehydrogenase subunit GcvPB [Humidesulfovibrio sp.]
MTTVFKKSDTGREGVWPDKPEQSAAELLPAGLLRQKSANLPALSELDVVRHFTQLSRRNFGVDGNFYPLGSCTMKYNP